MTNGWTAERKAKQAAAIQKWKPWTLSKGPRSVDGKAIVSRNAFKGSKRPALRQAIKDLNLYLKTNRQFLNGY